MHGIVYTGFDISSNVSWGIVLTCNFILYNINYLIGFLYTYL